MGKDFKLQVFGERATEWKQVLGTDIISVKSPIPQTAIVCGEERRVFMLDLDLLSNKQRNNLIEHLSKKFKQDREFVEDNLEKLGVPILAKDYLLSIKNPQKWF